MSCFLCVDIGAGTMDVLWFDTEAVHHYKAVVVSPVRTIAERADRLPGDLVVTGCEMGGGPVTAVLRQRAETNNVIVSLSAAATLHHDAEKLRSWGITVVEDKEAEKLRRRRRYAHLVLQDIEADRLERIVEGFGVPFEFDALAVCVQDHGVPPPGMSHLDFRHRIYKERLDARPHPHALLFSAGEVPLVLNRLRSVARSAGQLPDREVYVMDSGMAAVVGASLDTDVPKDRPFVVLDVATSHTVCAVLGGRDAHSNRAYVHYEIFSGGTGARAGKDGVSATAFHLSNCKTAPIEIIESEFPTRVERFEMLADSGGAGEWRGGLGFVRAGVASDGLSVQHQPRCMAPITTTGIRNTVDMSQKMMPPTVFS